MLVIRFRRIGKKHQTTYRLTVKERRSRVQGPPTEDLGWYNPHTKKHELKAERIKYWMSVGAKPSATAHNLLITAGVIEGKKIAKHKQAEKTAEAAAPAAAPAPAEKPAA